MAKGILAPLSPNEERTFKRIGFGVEGGDLDRRHIRRLLQLDLIEWYENSWQLTPLGRQRYHGVVGPSHHDGDSGGRTSLPNR